jgi:hypothetical protein
MGGFMRLVRHDIPDVAAVFECSKDGVQNPSLALMRAYRVVLDKNYAISHESIRFQVEAYSKARHVK